MKSRANTLILLAALAANAQAGESYRRDGEGIWSGPPAVYARRGVEERGAMREQWESLSPEERAYLRQQFRERVQALPPEERESRWREIMNHRRERSEESYRNRWEDDDDHRREGYGRGFERREDRYERSDRERGPRRDR